MNLDIWFRENEDWRPYADLVAVPPLPEEMMAEFSDISPEVLARHAEMVWECGGHVTRGAIYVRIRREDKKAGDKWAAMLALQAPPGVQTTDTFWAGRKPWHEVFGTEYANRIKSGLAAKGVNLKAGDEYMPELVRPGMGFGPKNPDPEAVVPFGGGRSHIKSLCEKRGWACEGAINVEAREPDRDPLATDNCVKMAPKLVRQKALDMVKRDPSLRKLPRKELREMVLAKHGPSK